MEDPHKKEMAEFFDEGRNQEWLLGLPTHYREFFAYSASVNPKFIREFFSNPKLHVVLDAGCGDCWYIVPELSRRTDVEVVGFDLSLASLRRAKQLAEMKASDDRLHLVQADIAHLPFRKSAFDGLLVMNVFHHYFHPRVVAALASSIRDDGIALVIETVFNNPFRFLVWKLRRISPAMAAKTVPELSSIGGLPPRPFFSWQLSDAFLGSGYTVIERHFREIALVILPQLALLLPPVRHLNSRFIFAMYQVEENLTKHRPFSMFTTFAIFFFRKNSEVSRPRIEPAA